MGKVIGDFFSQLLTTYANLLVHNELYHLRFFFCFSLERFFFFFRVVRDKKEICYFFFVSGEGDFFFHV